MKKNVAGNVLRLAKPNSQRTAFLRSHISKYISGVRHNSRPSEFWAHGNNSFFIIVLPQKIIFPFFSFSNFQIFFLFCVFEKKVRLFLLAVRARFI